MKPQRPAKNFREWVSKLRGFDKTNQTPCPHCGASGCVRPHDAYNDPVEGYKLAGWVDCGFCAGTGRVHELILRAEYREIISGWKARYKIWQECEAKKHAALAKLSAEDKRVLGL